MLLSLPEALFLSSYPPLLVFMLVLLSVHLSGHSSFHHSSFLHSFWGWIQSLFTLPDHSTDSHPWNDAIKDPTEAQSVMLTHAKPPQRAESSTQCWATGKSGGEGWRWLKKLCVMSVEEPKCKHDKWYPTTLIGIAVSSQLSSASAVLYVKGSRLLIDSEWPDLDSINEQRLFSSHLVPLTSGFALCIHFANLNPYILASHQASVFVSCDRMNLIIFSFIQCASWGVGPPLWEWLRQSVAAHLRCLLWLRKENV